MQDLLALSASYFPKLNILEFARGLRLSLQGAGLKDIWANWRNSQDVDAGFLWECVRRDREACECVGAAIIYPGHPEYPERLLLLEQPPHCLTYLGQPVWMEYRGLAGVGSREPHVLTEQWMHDNLLGFFRRHRVVTVSGGARGVDQQFHDLSLITNTPTIVHVPSGIADVYPRSLKDKLPDLAACGSVISRFAPHYAVQPKNFYLRNELIAQMADLVLILEARLKSGTGLTAQLALKNNIPLGVVPGHPMIPAFAGSLKLITEGAEIIRDEKDLESFWSRNLQTTIFENCNYSFLKGAFEGPECRPTKHHIGNPQ